jgi:hypothetical protein
MWPPVWTNTSRAEGQRTAIRGEVGVLKKCLSNRVIDNVCFLFIEHNGETYAGALFVDNAGFCQQILSACQQNVGRSIREIGDLDFSHTL